MQLHMAPQRLFIEQFVEEQRSSRSNAERVCSHGGRISVATLLQSFAQGSLLS